VTVASIRVALVEDEPSVHEAVERAMRREGFSVSSFGDYVEPGVESRAPGTVDRGRLTA
jgi:DNA-binding response OmpR family regulator